MEIKYVTLHVCSINNELDFCTQKLGFQLLKRTRFLNKIDCAILVKDSRSFGLILVEDGIDSFKTTVILNTDDFLKDHFELKDNGISFLSEPEYTPVGLTAAFMDPSDNTWILMEERDYSTP